MIDKLIELLNEADRRCFGSKQCENCPGLGKGEACVDYLIANHLLANGVIVPPCKVGDIVYAVSLNTETNTTAIHRGYVGSIDIRNTGNYLFICHEGFDDEPYFKNICGKFEDFGKFIFHTKEDANKALEEFNNEASI